MEKLKIVGNGPLNGDIIVSGAKNAALPILCASLLTADTLRLTNVPQLRDVLTTQKLLQGMGARVMTDNVHEYELTASDIHTLEAPYDLVKTMRASILVLGPTLARFGEASVSLPGGCAIGSRPVDQHIKGLAAMGADIVIEHGYVKARGKLKGARVVMDMVTVTGTENLLMAATLAEGTTILENAAREPEVTDLAECLFAVLTAFYLLPNDLADELRRRLEQGQALPSAAEVDDLLFRRDIGDALRHADAEVDVKAVLQFGRRAGGHLVLGPGHFSCLLICGRGW